MTITDVNRCPVLADTGNKTVNEGQSLAFEIVASDSDTGETLIYTASGLPLTSGATFDQAARIFTWTPDYTQAGLYSVTFQVSDGKCSDSETIVITVADVNLCPVLAEIGNKTIEENQLLTFKVTASDPDGDTLAYTASGLPLTSGAGFDEATRHLYLAPGLYSGGYL